MLTALITGANRGLGLTLTEKLLARGDRVIAAARTPTEATELNALASAHADRASVIRLDVGDEAAIREAFAALAPKVAGLDVLVNNAGMNERGEKFGSLTSGSLLELFKVNAIGALLVTQAAVELLRKGRNARVLNVSSLMGSISDASGGSYAYRMSKAAMNMASRALASDLRPHIAVRAVHPGWVRTRMGGVSAPVSVGDSVDGLVRLIDTTTLADSGTFVNYDGKSLGW